MGEHRIVYPGVAGSSPVATATRPKHLAKPGLTAVCSKTRHSYTAQHRKDMGSHLPFAAQCRKIGFADLVTVAAPEFGLLFGICKVVIEVPKLERIDAG